MWDSNITGQPGPPPARPLDLTSFAEDAARAGAVVLVAGRGSMAECGALQSLLQLNGVPFVGEWRSTVVGDAGFLFLCVAVPMSARSSRKNAYMRTLLVCDWHRSRECCRGSHLCAPQCPDD